MTKKPMSREEMIEAIQKIAQREQVDSVPRHQFIRETKASERQISLLFGSYNGLVEAAALKPYQFPIAGEKIYSDQDLLGEVVRVLRLPESKLTRIFFEQNATVSPSICERRFGGWINTLRLVLPMLNESNDKDLILRIREYSSPQIPQKPIIVNQGKTESSCVIEDKEEISELITQPQYFNGANIYGDFINFRGLQHAPVNEQGVVFLFGMICRELGYVVEIVKQGFPDCEAKRQIMGKTGKWQRVRIEFEYQSRSFQTHGHDPDMCDIIVCWEHNWHECPIEVLELRSVIMNLTNSV